MMYLSNTRLCKELWTETLLYVSHLINKSATTGNEEKTLFELWFGDFATDYDKLYVLIVLLIII